MNYRDIFDQAIGHSPPSGVDVDRVVRRQRRAARVRPVLASVAAVVVVAAGASTAVRLTAGEEDEGPPVPVPAGELAGFPAYVDGTVVTAAEEASMADGTLSLTFTRTTGDERLITRCEIPDDDSSEPPEPAPDADFGGLLFAEVSWADYSREAPYCPGLDLPWDAWDGPEPWSAGGYNWGEFWEAHGVHIGEPVTITITLTELWPSYGATEPVPLPPEGTFGLAVAQPVPFEDYPLPPPPASLEPLAEGNAGDFELRADPADPNRPASGTIVWDPAWCVAEVLPLDLVSQTPGTMEVQINDDGAVFYHTWWDYEQVNSVFDLSAACGGPGGVNPGDEVTINVRPEHVTGDWAVRISRTGG